MPTADDTTGDSLETLRPPYCFFPSCVLKLVSMDTETKQDFIRRELEHLRKACEKQQKIYDRDGDDLCAAIQKKRLAEDAMAKASQALKEANEAYEMHSSRVNGSWRELSILRRLLETVFDWALQTRDVDRSE